MFVSQDSKTREHANKCFPRKQQQPSLSPQILGSAMHSQQIN